MEKKIVYNEDGRLYLQMMQSNISRMAANSSNCKNWLIIIVSSFFAISCGINALNGWMILAIFPTIVFWNLDVYYLHLERKMRNRELDFILKAKALADDLQNDVKIALYNAALYNFVPLTKDSLSDEENALGFVRTNDRWFSESEGTFYLWVLGAIFVITVILNWDCIYSALSWICSLCKIRNV